MLNHTRYRLFFLFSLFILTQHPLPIVMADAAEDILTRVTDLVTSVVDICIVIIPSLILLGILFGYVQIAGPWGMQSVRKSGRLQIEMGFITLFLFIISPALLGLLLWIAKAFGFGG
jgi:hypothetical protein